MYPTLKELLTGHTAGTCVRLAEASEGYYPLGNTSAISIPSSDQKLSTISPGISPASILSPSRLSSDSIPSDHASSSDVYSSVLAVQSSNNNTASTFSTSASSNSAASKSGGAFNGYVRPTRVSVPYPHASNFGTASKLFPSPGSGYRPLPSGTASALNGIPPYAYPSATGLVTASSGAALPSGTGGYYPIGNASAINGHSTLFLTQFITQTLAPCTINVPSAEIYYWDTYRVDVTYCPTIRPAGETCTNTTGLPPMTLGAAATRTVDWDPVGELIPTSTSYTTYTFNEDYTDEYIKYRSTEYTDKSGHEMPTATVDVFGTSTWGLHTTRIDTSVQYSTAPYTAPQDVLRPDITGSDGYTYGYTVFVAF